MLTPLQKLLDRLADPSRDFAVIVEGKRDIISLRKLGIRRVYHINRYNGLEELAERLHAEGVRRVVVLTDFDRKGEELRKKLLAHLHSWGIVSLPGLRRRVRELTGVVKIEELYVRVLEMEGGDVYGEDIRGLREVSHSRKARGKRPRGQARRYRSHLRPDRRSSWRRARAT